MHNTSRIGRILSHAFTAAAVLFMIGTIMLTSNQFRFGALVIATESMTEELNKGDVLIFESYEGHSAKKGEVIAFEKNNSTIVHRIVDIEIINGITRYYTKGDANENVDAGYLVDADIIGLAKYKLPFFGYPTLWLRNLFKH